MRYPVHYAVEPPERFSRLQVGARIVALCILSLLGATIGVAFLVGFLGLPVIAINRLVATGDPAAYVEKDGPRVLRALRWFAAFSAWAGLVAEHLPGRAPDETVKLTIDEPAHPTPSSALGRVVWGIPSAVALIVLAVIGVLVWLWAAITVLFTENVGPAAFNYLAGLQRWGMRLLVYQASLVDQYPPFSLSEGGRAPREQSQTAQSAP